MPTINDLRQTWEAWGEYDPMWAVLSVPEFEGGRWKPEDFFATGRAEIDGFMRTLVPLQLPQRKLRALDFGCGVGRLTQALARHFEHCDGVDISAPMVENARRFNTHGQRCTYHVNAHNDLALFNDNLFDLIYTRLVLQHVPPDLIRNYLPEFVRVLRPGGIAAIFIPDGGTTIPTVIMPAGAYSMKIDIVRLPMTVAAGGLFECLLRVTNTGTEPWLAAEAGWLNVANHWLHSDGQMFEINGQRAQLTALKPGDAGEFVLTIVAPEHEGEFIVEFDVVHEGICWFADRGSQTARAKVSVTKMHALPATTSGPPRWEMHSLAKDETVRIFQRASGDIIRVDDHGPENSYREIAYYVTKKGT